MDNTLSFVAPVQCTERIFETRSGPALGLASFLTGVCTERRDLRRTRNVESHGRSFEALTLKCSSSSPVVRHSPSLSRRRALLSALAASLSVVTLPRNAYATESLVDLLVPVEQTKELMKKVPELIGTEEWDRVRWIISNRPVSKLRKSMEEAVEFLPADTQEAGLEETFDLEDNIKELDSYVYTNIYIPSKATRRRYVEAALGSLDKINANIERYVALFPGGDLTAAADKIVPYETWRKDSIARAAKS